MNRLWIALLALALLACVPACDKPTQQDCRKAVENIEKLYGTSHFEGGASTQAAVRSCQGTSSKETVQCYIRANSLDDVRKCGGEIAESFVEKEIEAEKKRKEDADKGGDTKDDKGGDTKDAKGDDTKDDKGDDTTDAKGDDTKGDKGDDTKGDKGDDKEEAKEGN
jgi:hypothetical protein